MFGEFAEQILANLISQGYSGNELLEQFKKVQSRVRPAVEEMLTEAERVAASESAYVSYEDIFDGEDDIYYNKTNYELAYTVEYVEGKIIVVIMAGTRENFYDTLKRYMR